MRETFGSIHNLEILEDEEKEKEEKNWNWDHASFLCFSKLFESTIV
jgi:hypothetical protein